MKTTSRGLRLFGRFGADKINTDIIIQEAGPLQIYSTGSIYANPLDIYTRSKLRSLGIKKIAVSSYAMLSKEVGDLKKDTFYLSVLVKCTH